MSSPHAAKASITSSDSAVPPPATMTFSSPQNLPGDPTTGQTQDLDLMMFSARFAGSSSQYPLSPSWFGVCGGGQASKRLWISDSASMCKRHIHAFGRYSSKRSLFHSTEMLWAGKGSGTEGNVNGNGEGRTGRLYRGQVFLRGFGAFLERA